MKLSVRAVLGLIIALLALSLACTCDLASLLKTETPTPTMSQPAPSDLLMEDDFSNDNNGYGVCCREQGDGDGYYLFISGDGMYSIFRGVEGSTESLVEWASSSAIRQGDATNHIRAICDGSRLTLVVNGEELASTTDSLYSEGDVGLAAASFESDPTEIHFDSFVVREP
jgi:hypothetical protein